MDPRPIVAALALRDEDDTIMENAAVLADKIGAPILPVHGISHAGSTATVEHRVAAAREAILGRMSAYASPRTPLLAPVVEPDAPSWLVAWAAAMQGAQIVVVGSGEGEVVRRFFLGSTAEHIARLARCPVWFARNDPPSAETRIDCAIDASPEAEAALDFAIRMARTLRSRLRLVHVGPAPRGLYYGAAAIERAQERLASEGAETVKGLRERHDLSGVRIETAEVGGRPGARLVDVSHDASLLVIGTDGLDRVHEGLLGPVAQRVVRAAPCSVALVRDTKHDRQVREARLRRVAFLRAEAAAQLVRGHSSEAEQLLEIALELAPSDWALEEDLARVLDAQGRADDAARARVSAARIAAGRHP